MAKKPTDKDSIRKIWLAGVGAYGRAYTEAKGAVDSLTGKGSEVFDELVSKGEMLEAVSRNKANDLVGKGKAAVEDITPDFDLDDRIAKMRERLAGVTEKAGVGKNDDRLAARVDQLEAKIDAILAKLDIGDAAPAKRKAPVTKASAKKAPAKKPKAASTKKMTTQRTVKPTSSAKTTSKTAASKKPAAKKPASKKSSASKSSSSKTS